MKIYRLLLVICAGLALQGCAGVIIGTAAVATKAAIDPRTVGTQVDDTTLDSRASYALAKDEEMKKRARVVVTSYHGKVLLTGQSPTQELINRAKEIILGVDGVHQVYNEVRLGDKVGLGIMSNDAWITTKVRSQLLTEQNVKARNIKVVTEDGEVFLFGILTRNEGKIAAQIASKVSGVRLVTTVYDYLD